MVKRRDNIRRVESLSVVKLHIFPDLEELQEHFDDVRMSPLAIPEDCEDGFLAAFWKRPQAYLSSEVRQSISSFSKIEKVSEGVEKLRKDLDDGTWVKRNHDILSASSLDVGYRIVSARVRPDAE